MQYMKVTSEMVAFVELTNITDTVYDSEIRDIID
jgi:hypothetical protein